MDEDIALLQEQLDEEVEYSTEMYERAQLAEADLATLRADLASSQVRSFFCPSVAMVNRSTAEAPERPLVKERMQLGHASTHEPACPLESCHGQTMLLVQQHRCCNIYPP